MTTKAEALAAFEAASVPRWYEFKTEKIGVTNGPTLALRVLTAGELDAARQAAEGYVDGLGLRHDRAIEDALSVEIIARAFFADGSPVFESADWLRERLTCDQLGALLAACNDATLDDALRFQGTSRGDIAELMRRLEGADEFAVSMVERVSREMLGEALWSLARAGRAST